MQNGMSPLAAARYICQRGNWRLTNLSLQKILYMAQMVHMGRTGGQRLVDEVFEAWNYGPVSPTVYQKVKAFGAKPIPDVFYGIHEDPDSARAATLAEACDFLVEKTPGELVALTHWKDGAWAKNYVPGALHVQIPDSDIVDEYRARMDG